MKKLKHTLPALLLAAMGFAPAASAALVSELGGVVVYDTDRNITWLANANLAASNTFGVSISNANGPGTMTWDQAQSWVAAMNAADYLGFSDWRLPTALNADGSGPCGPDSNCTSSELGHLFYQELGVTAGNSILSGNATELGKFSNIQSYAYWSGTEYAPSPSSAWYFATFIGYQNEVYKSPYAFYGWAVRSGDVAAVPLPAAVWLFGSALTGLTLLGAKRRRG